MSERLDMLLKNYAWNTQQINQLRQADKNNLDLRYMANPKLDWEQLREIRIALEYGVDPSSFANPDISSERMEELREYLFSQYGVFEERNEQIKRIKLKRIVITVILLFMLTVIAGLVFINRENILPYFETLTLELKTDKLKIGLSEIFDPMDYIKKYNKDKTLKIDKIDLSQPGNYNVTYKLSNKIKSISKSIKITVYDDIAPILELSSSNVVVDYQGNFNAADYILVADDNVDGDMYDQVSYTSIDTSISGNYTITYEVEDTAKNKTVKDLMVTVKDKPIDIVDNKTNSSSNNVSSNSFNTNVKPNIDKSLLTKIFPYSVDAYSEAERYVEDIKKKYGLTSYSILPDPENGDIIVTFL